MHIISPINAPWCAWVMLLLFICGILGEWLQPGIVSKASVTLTARITDRMYKDVPDNLFGQFCMILFRIGTLAMGLCLCFYPENRFPFVTFAAVFGLIVAVLMVKMFFNVLLDYAFSLSRQFGEVYDHYANVTTLAALILYPLLLILLRLGNPQISQWVVGITIILFLIMWVYRSIRTYVVSLPALLYYVVYLCTLELLPMAALVYLSAKMIVIL